MPTLYWIRRNGRLRAEVWYTERPPGFACELADVVVANYQVAESEAHLGLRELTRLYPAPFEDEKYESTRRNDR